MRTSQGRSAPSDQLVPAPVIERFAAVALETTGLVLDDRSASFLVTRLAARMRALDLTSYETYCGLVEDRANTEERRRFVSAVTTNTTSFMREMAHYDWLASEGLSELIQNGAGRGRPLIIWSAACSSGQELYSGLMVAREFGARRNMPLTLRGIGTDISPAMVAAARRSIYQEEEIEGLSEPLRRAYLLSAKSGAARYKIVPSLRELCAWYEVNLLDPKTLPVFSADIVFLRNVLIYFSAAARRKVLETVLSRMEPRGILLTGHTEGASVRGLGLEPLHPAVFRKVD